MEKQELIISGKVIEHLPSQVINGKNGTINKREFVLETSGKYPKKVCLQVMSEKVNVPPINAICDVTFDIQSREYNGRYYTQLTAYFIKEAKF